jgi:hypothetical protein
MEKEVQGEKHSSLPLQRRRTSRPEKKKNSSPVAKAK